MIEIKDLTEEDKGRNVRYIPPHAYGNVRHLDCENGKISFWNDQFIFVKYWRGGRLMFTSEATGPNDLVFVGMR